MIDGKRIAVVMPAYNAERTLAKTVRGLPGIVDIKILVGADIDKHRRFWRPDQARQFVHGYAVD